MTHEEICPYILENAEEQSKHIEESQIYLKTMSLQIEINYQNQPLIYTINAQEINVYIFQLNEPLDIIVEYVPEKIEIRCTGKLWVTDIDDHEELVNVLIKEIGNLNLKNKI